MASFDGGLSSFDLAVDNNTEQHFGDPSASDAADTGELDHIWSREAGLEPTDDLEWVDSRFRVHSEGYSPSMSAQSDRDSVVDSKGYNKERVLDRSWIQLEQKPVEFFWERGFWADIFGNQDSESASSSMVRQFSLHRPAVVSEPVVDDSCDADVETSGFPQKRMKTMTYMDVVSKSSVQSWREHRDSMWEVAIRRWHSSAMTWKGDDCFIHMVQSKQDFRGQCQIIVDILHHKAPATLLKRCNSLSRLVNDLHANGLDFPCSESELYDHMCRQRSAGAPSSRLKSLLEAVTFVRHVFGCDSLDFCTKSRRCMGAASSSRVETVKQAPPLTVEHLRCVHAVIKSDPDPWNVVFCGMVLFCVYGRARWSDAQHSQFIEWDVDSTGNLCFVECSTAVHKTCRSLNMRHAFLPLTAVGKGVTESCWATYWQRARQELDIEDLSIFPLMPSPDEVGAPTVRPLSTAEASKWLHVILQQQCTKMALQSPVKYTSHSFKATCLSYLAKFGSWFEDRLALGYHTDQVRMALRYSRDGASRPLRVLEDCISAIREGRFFPDETRSGRFLDKQDCLLERVDTEVVGVTGAAKQETPTAVDASEIGGETIDLVSDYATTCSESSSGEEAVVMPKAPNRVLLIPDDATFQVHCDKIDSTGWLKRVMARNQLRTFSDLGFAVGTPQAPASAAEFDAFCNTLNSGTDMTISEVSRVRRLHFEACTLIVAHTKQQVSLDSSIEGARKLPAAEKQARLQQQQGRLLGVKISGELQPSHALIDLAASMLDSNTVIWIGPSKCSKRESEIQLAATKEKSQILSVEQQTLKVTAAEATLKVDNNTELQLQWSLQRRGIALDQCRLIDWDVHQRWVQYLLGLLSKPAPEGYAKIKMDQVIRADKELFMIMAEDHQQTEDRLTDVPSPMNVAFQKLVTDPRVTMLLLPVPQHATRSVDFPLGLPNLSGVDFIRTQAANHVYEVTAELVRMLVAWGVFTTIENPTNSLFWIIPCIASLIEDLGGYDCIFDNCCHGGARKKSSKFWGSLPWLLSLAASCPGEEVHHHKSWHPQVVDGKVQYPTAEEAAYPKLLCTRLAEIVRAKLLELGVIDVDNLQQQLEVEQTSLHRVVLPALPRGKRFKPLVSEYGAYNTVIHSLIVDEPLHLLPPGAKLVHQRISQWGEVRVDGAIADESVQDFSADKEVMVSQFGLPRAPLDFCERAVKCGHPRGMAVHLPQCVKEVIEQNLSMEPAELALLRCKELTRWTVRAEQLKQQEAEYKKSLPEHMQPLMQKKRILLFKEMLEAVDYPDKRLIADMSNGFSITGWQNKTGVFPQCVKRPQFSLSTLKQMAQGLNRAILQQLRDDRDGEELVNNTWEKTLEEVKLGYIWHDKAADPMEFFLAKRFGLVQRAGKLRVIDDCSIGGINSTLGAVEKYRVHAMDECAAYLAYMVDFLDKHNDIEGLSGRTFDLKHAYKQYGISEADRKVIRLAVRNPNTKDVSLFGVNSLPFGASGSVGGFLRISLAVWFLGMTLLRLVWTAFFDDYTVFSRDALVSNTAKTVETLFDLLGIEFARDGDKACAFAKCFKSLGVEINLTEFREKTVRLGHTKERREELSSVLEDILKEKCITAKQAESMRGRLHWFESFAFGRVANGAVKVLGDLALSGKRKVELSASEVASLRFLCKRVLAAPPLVITPSCLLSWVVFTDGACEGPEGQKKGGVGGVLVDPNGRVVSFFGGEVPDTVMRLLLRNSKNPIYELEVLPVLISIWLWGERFSLSQVCWYLDNEASRSAFIKAQGATVLAGTMVETFAIEEMRLQIKSWFARVPSLSNLADSPSRLEDQLLLSLGAVKGQIDWQAVESILG
eukprot:s3918_g1.t1